jgi:hypothetical protein
VYDEGDVPETSARGTQAVERHDLAIVDRTDTMALRAMLQGQLGSGSISYTARITMIAVVTP